MLALSDEPAAVFLKSLGRPLRAARAILVATAHWDTDASMLGGAAAPDTIYDFYDFPDALYRLRYPASGAPDIAEEAAILLRGAGFSARVDPARGLDHGVWVPLRDMRALADIPVVPLSIQPHLGPAHHYAVGQALAPLRGQGVLVVGSGSMTHNLAGLDRRPDAPAAPWARAFTDWFADTAQHGRIDDLLDYRQQAPEAVRSHPQDEHLLPFFVALGAGGGRGARLHASISHGALAMDAYAFPALAA
jgi:4,5-DOPA dioxygenase extradiol